MALNLPADIPRLSFPFKPQKGPPNLSEMTHLASSVRNGWRIHDRSVSMTHEPGSVGGNGVFSRWKNVDLMVKSESVSKE